MRPARRTDAAAILAIYNDAVARTVATFDTEPRSRPAQEGWMREHDDPFVILVAVSERRVVGWAALSRWSSRRAYDRTAENSVYVAVGWRGHGIGSALLAHLVRHADERGFHCVIARIAEGNPASERLHAAAGFRRVGVLREVGWKFQRWVDVGVWQRLGKRNPS